MEKESARPELNKLIEVFKDNLAQYKLLTYKEAQVRKEFIDKFFKLLDWDVDNTVGNSEQFKDVINEDAIKIGGSTKAPDYAFRIGGQRIFFVEAKKPAVNLKDNSEFAYQLRHYAWNMGIPISILTNFDEFAVYDCRVKPNEKDNSSVARIMLISYEDYLNNFEKIWDIFSKEAVLKGSFARFVESSKGMKGSVQVNDSFLREIEGWRDELAKNMAVRNPDLSLSELNDSVQKVIDRIIFLIICEYKNIEQNGRLREIAEGSNIYEGLLEYFKEADAKYNSGIFDFSKDKLTQILKIDNKVLKDIVDNLYYPKSPYDFSVLPIEILGKVYEKFLGKTIRLTASHQAKVEEKPEVRKAGGVYYTPEFVVDYIIENTVGVLIKGKTPKQIEAIKILDPACGSGTFLVRAYTYILDYLLDYYKKNPSKYRKEIYQVRDDVWFLTTEIRKKVLLDNIYGVDIDAQAAEVTKLSLLLKVLENETKESVNQQLKLFKERALPNLDSNIRCGNSVVDLSYLQQQKLAVFGNDSSNVNPFDWNGAFPFKFDVIVGNPPYVKEYTNREIFEPVKKTEIKKYYQGKMDFWYFFTCKALDLLKENGLHSFIAQNNWITSAGASILRNKVLSESRILSFFDFNDFKVFKEAGIQTMVFVLKKTATNKLYSLDFYKITDKTISKEELINFLSNLKSNPKIEHFKAEINPLELKDKEIIFTDTDLSKVLERIKSKSNYKLKDLEVSTGIDVHQDFVNDNHIKIIKDGSIKKGDGIFNLTGEEYENLKLSSKEKNVVKPFYTTEQLHKYYGNPKNNLWIIYSDINVRKNIEEYPHIKAHLDRFKKVITSDFAPYGLHRAREQKFFEGEKIMSLRKTDRPIFTYTNFPCYVSQTYFVIKPTDINLKYLVGLLNSKLVNFWLYYSGKRQGEQLQIDKGPLLSIPLIKKDNKEIIEAVDLLMNLNRKLDLANLEQEKELLKKQISVLETKIDDVVYNMYSLSKDEKELINNDKKV